MFLYNKYSDFLKKKYGEKVYKVPVNLELTCPNRQDADGCSFCGLSGSGYESKSANLSVKEQIEGSKKHISKNYGAKKFIAYFQNYTNTYMPIEKFEEMVFQAAEEDIVEICISTRPDCISPDYLSVLERVRVELGVAVSIELGLQSVNYHSLLKINRGHSLAEFIDAVLMIKQFDFDICAHLILNLPWDDMIDVIENAKVLSALRLDQVKLHALYIVKNTEMQRQFQRGEFEICSMEEYIERVICFLEHLSPQIVVQRLLGRIPKEFSENANWSRSWWHIRDEIEKIMFESSRFQGKKFDYLSGSKLAVFNN